MDEINDLKAMLQYLSYSKDLVIYNYKIKLSREK